MSKSKAFREFFRRYGYLLVISAWCVTVAIIVDRYWAPESSLALVHKKVTASVKQAEDDFLRITQDTSLLQKIARKNYDQKLVNDLAQKNYFIFFYGNDENGDKKLMLWNTQKVLPTPSMLYLKGGSGFSLLKNGYYVWNNYEAGGLKAIALIPVKWNFFVNNDYLKNDFAAITKGSEAFQIKSGRGEGKVVSSIYGNDLFRIVKKSEQVDVKNNSVAVLVYVLAIVIFLFFIQLTALFISSTFGVGWGILFFFGTILMLRVLSYFMWLPFNLRQFELFDPSIYGSGRVLRSLGDLLINALIFVWFSLFLRGRVKAEHVAFHSNKAWQRWVMMFAASGVFILTTYQCSDTVRSLVADSQISFDVLNFFTLNFYSLIGFVILCCVAIGYFFICQVILDALKPVYKRNFFSLLLCITLTGLLYLTTQIGKLSGGIDILILLWLLAFIFLLNNNYLNLLVSHIISSRLVFWLFLFSISITSLIMLENREKELRNREHYAEILAAKADPSNETLLNTMLTDFRADYLADNYSRFLNENSNYAFKDSLIEGNVAGYTDRYETQIFSFDANERPLYNRDSVGYNELNAIINTQAKPTSTPDLFYYDVSFDKFSYISKKILRSHNGELLGYVFIIAGLKKIQDAALYPELFNRGRKNAIENSSLYSFAIYKNNKLVRSHNDYAFATSIERVSFPPQQVFEIGKGNYTELWYNAGGGVRVVIAKENSVSIESITLFSYLFCAFLLLTFIIWLLGILFNSRLNFTRARQSWQLSIRNQIHGTIIFICVVSFLVIGIATILFFITRYENTNRERLSKSIRVMENELKSEVINRRDSLDHALPVGQGDKKAIEASIRRISEVHGTDVNLYDLEGRLLASSLPLPYIKGIVSTMMNPVAFYHLHRNNEVQYFQEEEIGRLRYVSNYKPVIDENGDKYAYLNIPYFTSQENLKEEISNFIVTIINLNAFIFLVAGVIALFITNRITRSFSLIGEKMKKINLESHNEAIIWTRNDEIGELVAEYNKMVEKLDESARALAKTEREGAWREMAKQIAHEIKNPLTPMKLSMQYLQKAIEKNSPDIKSLITSVSGTLVEQIDHLSLIASEFSQFANIENAKREDVDLTSALHAVLNLYSINEDVYISRSLLPNPAIVEADKTHINRIFTNLLQNAIQAVPQGEKALVSVDEYHEGNSVVVRIADNGHGIDESIRENIFTPNFTTKSSGTGLGLAMCKRMVEHAHGEIWFVPNSEKGTTFFVKLPLKQSGSASL